MPSTPAQFTARERRSRWWRRRSVLSGIALLGICTAAALILRAAGTTRADEAAPLPVVTASTPLQREITEWDEYTGQLAAVDYVEIRARVSGYLTEIHFTDGQIVQKGDLLFVIDPRPFEIELQEAQAQFNTATATLELANRQLTRAESLRGKDYVAQSTYDERLQAMKVAAAQLETAKASVRQAELDLEFSHITSPLTGRISQHMVSLGNLVSGGTQGTPTLLTTIVSLDPIYLNFDMSEAQYLSYERAVASGKMKSNRGTGIPVAARLSDEIQWLHPGEMNFIDNQVDRSAGTIRARGLFPNADLSLTPGQFARIRIPGSEPYQAILVPDLAVVTDQSTKLILTVTDDDTIVPKIVRLGPTMGGLRVIRSGLTPKDRVVINGLARALPGAKVSVQTGEIKWDAEEE
jgi:RND family efflux transporter MFP subunit